MRRYRITTPEPGWTGTVGAVAFANGVADCEADSDAAALAYFHAQGYGVEPLDGGEAYRPPGARTVHDDIADLEAKLAELRAQTVTETDGDKSKPTRGRSAANTKEAGQ